MSKKSKILIQKRSSLRVQLSNLANLVDAETVDKTELNLRYARLTELHHAYEDYNDKLMIIDPSETHAIEFTDIHERFYALSARVERVLHAVGSSSSTSINSVNNTESQEIVSSSRYRRCVKLPEIKLPTFNGKFENWLSFKNAFNNIIDSQADLSDVDKFHYLKSALIDDAANKLKIFSVDGVNYSRAWDLLVRAYEVKRVLISSHLSALLNLPSLDKESTSGLTRLANDAQQHVASLISLGATVGSEMFVYILETELPKTAAERWERSIERDEIPSPDQLYEFLYRSAVCASKRERIKFSDSEQVGNDTQAKRRRTHSRNRAFMAMSTKKCIACKVKQHPLYSCEAFKKLTVPKRIDLIKNAKLCYNCMRSHRDQPCKFSNCTICSKKHNTLLHLDHTASVNTEGSEPSQTSASSTS